MERCRVEIAAIVDSYPDDSLTLTAEDIDYIETLASHKRRCEVASWRSLVRRVVGCDNTISYRASGAPFIVGGAINIGVSHSSRFVAIALSEEGRVGIDIESCSRNYATISSRFATAEEIGLFPATESNALATIWSAKEALFKLSDGTAVDLIKDITINSVDGNTLSGSVQGAQYTLHRTLFEGHVLVWAIG